MGQRKNSLEEHTLEQLRGSKYEIVPSQPDVVGWWVTVPSGLKIGNVDDLIFDPASRKVRFLVINLSDNDFGMKSQYLLIPIAYADLRTCDALIVVPEVSVEDLQRIPDYRMELLNDGTCHRVDTVCSEIFNPDRTPAATKKHNGKDDMGQLETFKDGELSIKIYKEISK